MDDELKVSTLYQEILNCWNDRNAHKLAALFEQDGTLVGLNGSQYVGRAHIESDLRKLFRDKITAVFIGLAREVRCLSADVRLVRAVAGMIQPGKSNIDPSLNTVQVIVTRKYGDEWCVSHFQNTPVEFHGRREVDEKLTEELVNSLTDDMREKLMNQLEKDQNSGNNRKNGKNSKRAKSDNKGTDDKKS